MKNLTFEEITSVTGGGFAHDVGCGIRYAYFFARGCFWGTGTNGAKVIAESMTENCF